MSKESKAYEDAKALAVAEVVQNYREAWCRTAARELFGGTPEQQEETYQYLMGFVTLQPD